MVPPEYFDAERHGSGRGLFPMKPWRPALRIGETRESLTEARARRKATVQDVGESLDLDLCQVDASCDTLVLLPMQPLDGWAVEGLDVPAASRLDPAPGFGLSDHPGRELSEFAEQLGFLVLTQAEPVAQIRELLVEHGVGLGLKSRHGRTSL
jgi:hypothetical protein